MKETFSCALGVLLFLVSALACNARSKEQAEIRKNIERIEQEQADDYEEYEEEDYEESEEQENGEVCPGVTQEDIDRVEGKMGNLQGELVVLDSSDMKVLSCSRKKKRKR